MTRVLIASLLFYLPATLTHAQTLRDFIPANAKHCDLKQPPADAGLIPIGGGFLVVYPRNAQLRDDHTGCKLLWIAETGNRFLKIATLYYKEGKLTLAATHAFRDSSEKLDGLCSFPAGKSLMPDKGRQIKDAGCGGFSADAIYALRTPSYPRKCAEDTKAKECDADPQ